MKKTICVILATAFAATLQAAIPLDWSVETTRAQPAAFDCYRGETLTLRASLFNAGTALDVSGAAASLYWQTNGMGEVYWSAPATAASNVLSATWAPTNDVGAASYNCFIGVAGEIYRAAFRIRMLPSPGAVPSELDLPAKSIDFATVTVINPPYYTQGEVDSALASAAQSATNYVNAVAAGKQDTISDLAAIRSGAALGETALQSYTESDPVWTAEKSGYATTNDFAAAYGMAFHASMVSDEVKVSLDDHRDNTNVHVTPAEKATWNAKQSALAFDTTPTAGSTNPVTSGGVQTALAGKQDALTAQQLANIAAVPDKLDKSGGTMTGVLHIPYSLLSVEGGVNAAAQWHLDWGSAMDEWEFVIKPENSSTRYRVTIPRTNGALALTAGTGHTGNLAALDAYGNPVDSGKSAADFATAASLTAHTGDTTIHVTAADKAAWSGKQDTISDLAAIRSGAALGETALQSYTETDPTVPAWAKAASKPAYTYSEITGKPTFATVATSGSYNDLTDKPTIPSPTAPVASATLAWQSNGSAIVVSVGAAGTLSATLTGWIEGQTQTALITIAAGASVSSEVKLVGYGTWPTSGQFLASATRVGNNVYVTPIVLVN